ncbi:MAG: hypothetical protein BWY74_03923 [Firmicutes bacterium ADurb.Bin419]|nr:MAG: hypothetical protein BWY74_03923 [Firmicutes bacterium ADurb.Bin419]
MFTKTDRVYGLAYAIVLQTDLVAYGCDECPALKECKVSYPNTHDCAYMIYLWALNRSEEYEEKE